MSDLNNKITILSISDLHLGHPSISPLLMCDRYRDLIYPLLGTTDILLIDGDLFDSTITLADVYINDIIHFLVELIDKCIEHKVTIVCVRGTFSHDRDQIKVFYTLAQNRKMGKEFLYFDTISLAEIKGRTFLFLPDDLPYKNSDEILDVVHTQMNDKGYTTVDYAFTHGYFQHVVPQGEHQPKICFRYDQFNFVTRLIVSGHVHTTSVYTPEGKTVPMLYNGSPERLRHGEEESKGCYVVEDERGQPLRIRFIENKSATVFKEYNDALDADNAIGHWRSIFDKYKAPVPAYLKFTHPDVGIRLAVEKLAKGYPNIIFTHRSPKESKKHILSEENLSVNQVKTYVPTKESFSKDVLAFLKDANRGEGLTLELIETYLKEI